MNINKLINTMTVFSLSCENVAYWVLRVGILLALMCLSVCYCWTGSETAEVLRPRGVPLAKKGFYEPGKDFTCIDGAGLVPFHFVNDDYCDCNDGSDEPGTSACINGEFHCANTGYVPINIPSSRVNDNVCDCCDGSDEYNSHAECTNKCFVLGKQAQEEAQKQQELLNKGFILWQEYAVQGKQIKENNRVKLQSMKMEEEEAEKVKNEKEAIKLDAEDKEKLAVSKYEILKEDQKREVEEFEMQKHQEEEKLMAENAFKELDMNQDGVLTYNEIQQVPKFDSNHDGVVSEDEGKFFLHMKDSMKFEEFITTGWMIMKPLYFIDKTGHLTSPDVTKVSPEELGSEMSDVQTYPESYDQETDLDDNSVDDDDEDVEPQPVFPPKDVAEENSQNEVETQYDDETQKLVNDATQARLEFKDAFDKLENIRNEIKQIQVDLDADFGQEQQFAVLKGLCFDYDDREYTYKLCPFDRASQIPKSGGSETNLGKWGSWAGPEGNRHSKMQYENGHACWNGPTRSAMVLLHCGLENEILSTSEPNRCEYLFEFSTPALCFSSENKYNIHEHTEL